MKIKPLYETPDIIAVSVGGGHMICTSPGGELSSFGYEQITGDDGFTIEED